MVFQRLNDIGDDVATLSQADGSSLDIRHSTIRSLKRDRETNTELQPSDFQRVRLMRKSNTTESMSLNVSSISGQSSTTPEKNTPGLHVAGARVGYIGSVATFNNKARPRVRCEIQGCAMTFVRLQDMIRHKAEVHAAARTCPWCEYATRRDRRLLTHIEDNHRPRDRHSTPAKDPLLTSS